MKSTFTKLCFISGFTVLSLIAEAQVGNISTIAGTNLPGYNGDGGQAVSAELYNPEGVALDAIGNIYVADAANHRIRKIDLSGVITTVAGNGNGGNSGDGGQAVFAELNFPDAIAVDGAGNLYIADETSYCVRKVNTSGVITTVAGNGTLGYSGDGGAATSAQLNIPAGVAL
ncbi:MAG TPA: hypothetical protein VFJ43_07795, partial [Bacteroidia bacterium]|nr:hypothetical protein [Bacteroidia bacterium]